MTSVLDVKRKAIEQDNVQTRLHMTLHGLRNKSVILVGRQVI